ncbi:MAG TPA: hypothetical protein DD416_10435 [Rhodobacteraceae bacterium]|mgnify:CR=1 FL=1|jgi:DNA-binding MarR family transcriptional regulator|nr:hypothetical protein [Pseudomonadota bacterium]NQW12658.1 hypothetical protein [Rhodobacter sp.]HBN31613.1 hypothetical protein [Paracoccaceae bacterium]
MTTSTENLDTLIFNICETFNDFKVLTDDRMSDLGITAAMGVAMDYVYLNGPSAVPDIARAKSVSRQHIQKLTDALIGMGMVMMIRNPLHKRSALVALTPKGRQAFKMVRARQAAQLARLASQMDETEVVAANKAVQNLRRLLAG